MELSEKASIGGTLLWYYSICPREVWLMSRKIIPEQKDENVVIGRLIDKNSYVREKHQISFGDNKFDFIQNKDGSILVSEIKKAAGQRRHRSCSLRTTSMNWKKRDTRQGALSSIPGKRNARK